MTHLKKLLLLLALTSSCVWAEPASDATIKKLLEVSQARATVDAAMGQVKSKMDDTVRKAFAAGSPNERQKQAISNMFAKIAAVVQQQNSWEQLEPKYVRLYRETFTEEELIGMIHFYESPAGQAVIKKMPKLMQQLNLEIYGILSQVIPKLETIQKEFIEEFKQASR